MVVPQYEDLLKTQPLRVNLAALVFLAFCSVGCAQTMDEIVNQAVAVDEKENELLKQYEYQQTLVSQRLDGDDKVKETLELALVIHPGQENGFTIVSGSKAGVMMPTSEVSKLEKQAKESEMFKSNFSLRKLAPRFDKQLLGQEVVNGRSAYVIQFTPKVPQPEGERIEKILNNLQGKIWISTSDYAILKTQATLAQPVDLAWFFATMEKMDFYYESQPVDGGYGPAKFNLSYEVSVLIGKIRDRQMITMFGFQKVKPTSGG